MVGAIEFLRKAEKICESRNSRCSTIIHKEQCPVYALCNYEFTNIDEADLVKKVMGYKLE